MPKTDLSAFNNDWYNPGPKVKLILWYIVNAFLFRPAWNASSGIKLKLLRWFGAKIGKGVVIKPKVNIKYPWKLVIGDHSWIGEEVWIDNLAEVCIGDNVCISQGVFLECGNHNYKKTGFDLMVKPITLEEGCWVGARCNIAPGVTLGSHAILTMGSTAVSDLEPYGIYSGSPAKYKKKRDL
jgi:putative colanic acid biosynthesis acetyltransferase WcaF